MLAEFHAHERRLEQQESQISLDRLTLRAGAHGRAGGRKGSLGCSPRAGRGVGAATPTGHYRAVMAHDPLPREYFGTPPFVPQAILCVRGRVVAV